MKKLAGLFILSLISLSSGFYGCKSKPGMAVFTMPDSTWVEYTEDSVFYQLESNTGWSLYSNASSWVTISPSYGSKGSVSDTIVRVKFLENTTYAERKAKITFSYGENYENIKTIILQQASGPERLNAVKKEITIPYDEVRLFVGFDSNIDYELVAYPSWMKFENKYYVPLYSACDPMEIYASCQMSPIDSTSGGVVYPLFTFEPNSSDTDSREGVIKVKWKEGELTAEVKVKQEGVGSNYFYLERSSSAYETIPAGLEPSDVLTRQIVARSTYSSFDYSLTDTEGNPISWARLEPAKLKAAVGSYSFTLSVDKNTSAQNRGFILEMWPQKDKSWKQSIQYLQLGK